MREDMNRLEYSDVGDLIYENRDLFYRYYETHSKELRDQLIVENMTLVSYVSYRLSLKTGIDVHELESYGSEGLIKAVENFNPIKGYPFYNYAYSMIRGTILCGISKIQGYKHVNFYNDFLIAKRIIEEEFVTTLEESPEIVDDIVKLLVISGKISADNFEAIRNKILLNMVDCLDDYIDVHDDSESEELIENNLLPLQLTNQLVREQIYYVLDTLPEREKLIIIERFGLEDGIPKTLQELSDELHVPKRRIHAIEVKALCKLRHPSRLKYLQGYIEKYDQYNYEPNYIKINLLNKQKK